MDSWPERLLERTAEVRGSEVRALLLAFAYFFCLLTAYYLLRPVRDEMGIAGGVRQLQWLFTGTFAVMLLAVPLFGMLVAKFPRRRFLPAVYWFFIANLLIFYGLFGEPGIRVYVGRAFFIWVSVFNLFVISVFWSFMADLFSNEQGKRLFGFIAAGGSLGAITGPTIAAEIAVPFGPDNLLLISCGFLMLAVACIHALLKTAPQDTPEQQTPIGGGILAGASEVFKSSYLLGICLYLFLYTASSTFLYFLQADIVSAASSDPSERVRIFARIDQAVGLATILIQCFITGRFMRRFGVGLAAALLPVVTIAGFAALAVAPGVLMVTGFQTLRRAVNFGISRPAREVLFTVISREQKYKSKNFIDTVIYRGGDAISGWAIRLMGLEGGLIALVAAPAALLWIAVALALGKNQDRMASQPSAAE